MYTAVTRCCDRLVFLESRWSLSGSAFFRHLQDSKMADPLDVVTLIASETKFMAPDEWVARGIDFALASEGDNAVEFFSKAALCFDRGGNMELREFAQDLSELEKWKSKLLSNAMEDFKKGDTRIHFDLDDQQKLVAALTKCFEDGFVREVKEVCEIILESKLLLKDDVSRHFFVTRILGRLL